MKGWVPHTREDGKGGGGGRRRRGDGGGGGGVMEKTPRLKHSL